MPAGIGVVSILVWEATRFLYVSRRVRTVLPAPHPVGDTFHYHDPGHVGVGAGDVGHNRSIHYPQSLDSMYPTVLVNHGHEV